MQVSQIDDLHQFNQLKQNWESVYAADTHAHIFVSWMWLRGWFEIAPFSWFVLAVRPDKESPYVAFLPLNMRFLRINGLTLIRELRLGSKPLGGYTGFVCLPEYEAEAIAALARHIQQELDWDSFQMEHVLDPRLDLFLKRFSQEDFQIVHAGCMPSTYVSLPDRWDEYLQSCLGNETRKNLKKCIRRIERQAQFKMIHAQAENLDSQIEAALTLNQSRWGPKPEHRLMWERSMFRHCFEQNSLWIGALWDDSTPMSAQVALIDQKKKTLYTFFTGYNDQYAGLSPGTVMIGLTIQNAIHDGLRTLDFLMGEEKYKFTFGATRRADAAITRIKRRSLRNIPANLGLDVVRKLRDFPNIMSQHRS